MSKEYGYIGKEVTQAFRDNKGIFTPQDIIELDQENKWTNFGQLEFIETITLSSVSSANFNNLGTFNTHLMTLNNIQNTTDIGRPILRYIENGVVESAGNYQFANFQLDSTGSSAESKNSWSTSALLCINNGSGTNEKSNAYTIIYNAIDSTKFTYNTVHSSGIIGSSNPFKMWYGSCVLEQRTSVTGFNISVSSGTLTGQISLYGLRFS